MLTTARCRIHPKQLAKRCVIKLKLYESSCIVNGNTYSNQFARWISSTKLSPADHSRDRSKAADVAGQSFAMCDSSCGPPSFVIRGLDQTLARNIPSQDTELKNMQKILRQVFVGQKQNIRTIYTQTQLAQQEQTNIPPPQKSPPQSDSENHTTDHLTRQQKLKRAVKEYGSTVMVFHISISLLSLGAFYVAVSSGIDMVSIMSHLGVADKIQQSQLAAGASTFVVAYAIHKVFAPVRIGITLTATPLIVRYLRLKGILKPPKQP